MSKTSRNYGLDIYRVLCISLVILGHIKWETDLIWNISFSENAVSFVLMETICNFERLAVNGFVMISAWFLYGKKGSGKSIIRCWLMVFLTNVIVTIIVCALGLSSITSIYSLQAFSPIVGRPQWYMCEYLLLLITHPMIDSMVDSISMKQHKFLLLIGGIFIVLLASVMVIETGLTMPLYSEYIWFVYQYIFIVYIKKYPASRLNTCKRSLWVLIGCLSAALIPMLVIAGKISGNSLLSTTGYYYTVHCEAIPCFVGALGLFMGFSGYAAKERAKGTASKIVGSIATYTGYIYIVHSVPVLWRGESFRIWTNLFHIDFFYEKGLLIPGMLMCTILVIVIGLVGGKLINELMINPLLKTKLLTSFTERIDSMYS